jgi:ABC-type dipeptide/oligopeptide/nickel transport system permease component
VFGIPLGVHAALRRRHWDARLTMAVSLLGVSLPTFLIGIVLIEIFSVLLGWFPSFGRGTTVQSARGAPACSRPTAGATSRCRRSRWRSTSSRW